MELSELRTQIDEIDSALLSLFLQRMELSAQIAAYKKEHDLPISDPCREREILQALENKAAPQMAAYVRQLYDTIFALSKDHQKHR